VTLLAQRLQRAGIQFVEARARHLANHLVIESIVVPTDEDFAKVLAWASVEEDVVLDPKNVTLGEMRDEY
jgi:hypothetical protein